MPADGRMALPGIGVLNIAANAARPVRRFRVGTPRKGGHVPGMGNIEIRVMVREKGPAPRFIREGVIPVQKPQYSPALGAERLPM
jgi:hypothetical protein